MKIDLKLLLFFVLTLLLQLSARGESYALGLGDIKVKTAFNKKFIAEIPLFLSSDENKVEVFVGSATEYKILQLERPDFIESFKVSVMSNPKNRLKKFILISSVKTILKPSFNLVIKATSGGGTLLENYFLVLDFKKSLSLELPEEQKVAKVEKPKPIIKKPVPFIRKRRNKTKIAELKKEIPLKKQPKIKTENLYQPRKIRKQKFKPKPKPLPKQKRSALTATTTQSRKQANSLLKTAGISLPKSVKVRQGDYLFKIVGRLGIPKHLRKQIVNAIYRRNQSSFINKDVNLIGVGVELKLDNIEELEGILNDRLPTQEHEILEEVFPALKAGSSNYELPITEHIPTPEIQRFITGWRDEWASKNFIAFGSRYATTFRDNRGRSKDTFLASRTAFTRQQKNIKIDFENISIIRNGQAVSVYFTQWFRSNSYTSIGLKRLKIRKTTDGLKIANESFSPNKAAKSEHPWIVFLSQSRDINLTKKNLTSLKLAGFEAFEAGTFLNDNKNGYHILVGRVGSRMLAKKVSGELKKLGKGFTKVLRLPFALDAGSYKTYTKAKEIADTLSNKGYSPYIQERIRQGQAGYQVLLGAFSSKGLAEKTFKKINSGNLKITIITP